jgi:polyisoprenoid-binding protein YceI
MSTTSASTPTTTTSPAPGLVPGTWAIDAAHSSVEFVARHLMVSKVRGRFTDFSGTIEVAEDPLASSVQVEVQMASVDTNDAGRDEHLRTNDFFDVANHPTMSFRSTGVRVDGDDLVVSGELTLRGVTRVVDLRAEFNGVQEDPWGGTRAGFSADAEINRKDFGVSFNAALEGGGVLVGDKVKIHLVACWSATR